MRIRDFSAILVVTAWLLGPVPAAARILNYSAELSGANASTDTGSTATGSARIRVDTDQKTISLDLDVKGLRIDELWDNLVRAPAGPIHFHRYASHDHSDANSSVLVLPVPFGDSYSATETGFSVRTLNYEYAAGAAILGSKASFEDFLEAMNTKAVVLNIHTDAFEAGEISGPIHPGQ